MCGIAGWIDWNGQLQAQENQNVLSAMIDTLQLRGPDDQGRYVREHVAFGHRRLSVVDPQNGAQPMVKKRGGYEYAITYNGELYNTVELRDELKARGYTFETNCDTEVLLVSYMEYGIRCVEKLNGIFAFGIWDEAKERLFIARDRIGVKPLFYAERGNQFLFGSEIKTLLANPLVQPEVDMEGLAEIFMIGPARTPGNGIYRGVFEVKPGHALVYSQSGKRNYRYWSLCSQEHEDDFETTVQKVRELLIDTAKRQLIADVDVCTFLSGGLDSSALTALAAMNFKAEGRGQLHTYSVDYIDNDKYFKASAFQPNSDAPWVEKMTEAFGTCHHRILIDNIELAKCLPKATIARDFPGMADVDTSLYLFAREIKKGATVALSGECADEIDIIGLNQKPNKGGIDLVLFYQQSKKIYIGGHIMPSVNNIYRKTREISGNISDLLKDSTYCSCGEFEDLEINRQDSDEIQLLYELRSIMDMLIDVKDRIDFLSYPISEISVLHKNLSGRYETNQGKEFTCGSMLEAFIDDGYHDVPHWVRTRVEAKSGVYYLVGVRNVSLEGLKVRTREASE